MPNVYRRAAHKDDLCYQQRRVLPDTNVAVVIEDFFACERRDLRSGATAQTQESEERAADDDVYVGASHGPVWGPVCVNTISTRRFFCRPSGSSEPSVFLFGATGLVSPQPWVVMRDPVIDAFATSQFFTASARFSDNFMLYGWVPLPSVCPSISIGELG